MNAKISNELLKPIIDEILVDYYSIKTRLQHDSKDQYAMLNQNKGLTNACSSVIMFAEDEKELVEYTKAKIEGAKNGEVQEVVTK